jgi:hypothetical protein
MRKRDDYRAKAEYCRDMATKVTSPLDEEEWLQQATNWRTLAALSDRDWRSAGAEMNDPTHEKQMEDLAEIWERLASRLSKEKIDKA